MNNKINIYIELIKSFEDKDKFYWIQALNTSDSIKGYLIIYFNV